MCKALQIADNYNDGGLMLTLCEIHVKCCRCSFLSHDVLRCLCLQMNIPDYFCICFNRFISFIKLLLSLLCENHHRKKNANVLVNMSKCILLCNLLIDNGETEAMYPVV